MATVTLRRRVTVILAATAMAAGALAISSSNTVGAGASDCPSSGGPFCTWSNVSFGGSFMSNVGDLPAWPSWMINADDSNWNRSTRFVVRQYDFTGFGGYYVCWLKSTSIGNIPNIVGQNFDDRGASHTFNSVC